MKVGAVIVCAGQGRRLGRVDKPVLKLKGKPLFYHTFKRFEALRQVKEIAVVLRKAHFPLARRLIRDKRLSLVEGGRKREDSVYNGLKALGKDIDYALIHDGARPFVSKKVIERVITQLKKSPAVICAIKAKDTLKSSDSKGFVKKTLDRENILFVQTPQGFKKGLILKAYKEKRKSGFFDDAQVLELTGKRVKIVRGDILNIKITYPQDVVMAEALMEFLRCADDHR